MKSAGKILKVKCRWNKQAEEQQQQQQQTTFHLRVLMMRVPPTSSKCRNENTTNIASSRSLAVPFQKLHGLRRVYRQLSAGVFKLNAIYANISCASLLLINFYDVFFRVWLLFSLTQCLTNIRHSVSQQ